MKKPLFTIVLLISFIAAVLFGFLIMESGEHGGCIAADITGSTCPLNVLEFALHHIIALQSFVSALVVPLLGNILLFILLLFIFAIVFDNLFAPSPQLVYIEQKSKSNSQRDFIHWLSLFENSPSK